MEILKLPTDGSQDIYSFCCNVEIKKYKLQVDIGILFSLSIWVHLVKSSLLFHLEPVWTKSQFEVEPVLLWMKC